MINIKGEILINRNPKKAFERGSYCIFPKVDENYNETGGYVFMLSFDTHRENIAEFTKFFEEKYKRPALEQGLKLNGTLKFENPEDLNEAGDFIVKNTYVMIQPVLPMF